MSNARNIARLLPSSAGVLPDANLGSISPSKLSSKVPNTLMSAGSVIQVIKAQSPYGEVSVSNGSTATLISQSITTQANSRLYVIFFSAQIQAIPYQTNWNPQFRVTVDGSDIDVGATTNAYNHVFYDDGSSTARIRPVITGTHLSDALSAGTHTVVLYGGSYNATVVYNYQSGPINSPSGDRRARMIIMEIAG